MPSSATSTSLRNKTYPKVVRQLSDNYNYKGSNSADDPNSYDQPDQLRERISRENAVLRDLSYTGYADGIKNRRAKIGNGFFKPYADIVDFKDTLVGPIVEPIYLGYLSITLIIDAVYSSLAFLLHTAAAFCAYFYSKDEADYQIESAKLSFIGAKTEAMASILTGLSALLAGVESLLKLVTRSASTIVGAIIEPYDPTEDAPIAESLLKMNR